MADLTVAICTWNRAALLDRTLAEMRRLEVPPGATWELLVINNGSTDDTDAVLDRHARHLPLRRFAEPRQGKSHAANLALEHARGDLIVWTDDDVLVDPAWLTEHWAAARRWPDAAYFGGLTEPWFAVEPPAWIRQNLDRFQNAYAIVQRGDDDRPFRGEDRFYPVGANLAFRGDVLRAFRFDTTLGPYGAELRRGEESDLLVRLERAGHHGVYVSRARVKHYIPAERLSTRYLWEWFRWEARVAARRQAPEGPEPPARFRRQAVRKYLVALAKLYGFSAFKGRRWLSAFFATAWWRGVLDEAAERGRGGAGMAEGRSAAAEIQPG